MVLTNSMIIKIYRIPMLVPAPYFVNLSSSNPIWPIGSDINLTCSVQLNQAVTVIYLSSLIVDIQLSRNGIPLMIIGSIRAGTTFTFTTQLNSFGRNHSGNYTCTATVESTIPYLNASRSVNITTRITTG